MTRSIFAPAPMLALLIMAGAAIGMGRAIELHGFHLQKLPIEAPDDRKVAVIPTETPGWIRHGGDKISSADVVKTLGTDNYVSRYYREKSPAEEDRPILLELHAAYYTGMIDTVPHVPERCFVGGGLQQAKQSRVLPLEMDVSSWVADPEVPQELAGEGGVIYTVRNSNRGQYSTAPGRRVRLPRDIGPDQPFRIRCSEFLLPGDQRLFAGYFFIANGGTVPNANDVRTLAFNLTSDYAYYLKIQVTSSTCTTMEEFVEHAGELLGELAGEVMLCVPDWIEVETGNYPEDNPRRAVNDEGS